MKLPTVVDFCYDGVKVLFSPGDKGRAFDFREDYISI